MTDATGLADDEGRICDCKVGRVLERWGRADLHEDLATDWSNGTASLRDLERRINQTVLREAVRRAGAAPLDGEVENVYRLLTDDEVTSGMRRQAENRLERDGVDVDAVRADFVSHQTVHNHLRSCLDAERDTGDDDPVESAEGRIRSLQARLEAVTDDAVDRLRDEHLALAAFDVFVDVSVACEACGRRHEIGELLAEGGCECQMGDGS